MPERFFSGLSKNYIEILDDDEYYDITIEVGEDPYVKIFHAHMIILHYRSPFLRRILSSNKKNDNGILAHIKLSNISPEIFQIILKYIYDCMSKSPQSFDFTSLPEKSLVSLIKRDDLQMEEVEVLENVLKWGLEKHPTLLSDPATWTDDDFKMMKNTLQHYLPLVRFFCLSSKDFYRKVHPYKKIIKPQLYEDLLISYLEPDNQLNDDILLPRYKIIDGIIDSRIINLNIASLISSWIDKINLKSKFDYIRKLYLPYEFKLLLRGTRDGFTPKKFHKLCDNIPHTVIFIKIKGTEEIIGGYNPLEWVTHVNCKWGKTKDSFIFSFKSKNDYFKDPILSHVKDMKYAIFSHTLYGPTFDDDINIRVDVNDNSKAYNYCRCKQESYEKKIRDKEDNFLIEDYEVFQIIKKNTN
ncbi:uncharacterized protein OCT59_029182 [Rhizophagus irregularis]|uniref:uncharacterized protein n=1 Tax=Rhizophagus irregularis TaxID=588596 RepID=UPI0033247CF3|nr:hypothetical protein OCT59_029182 [Rhizophagus irregularis]